jgi:predicted O-methyltransferase YrrM
MDFLPKEISAYAEKYTHVFQSTLLEDLEEQTRKKMELPQMLSGFLQGQFLSFFSRMVKPSCILEIGTFTGYSAICLAEGLAEDGVLHTIDINEDLRELTEEFIGKANLKDKVNFHVGNALEIIPTLDQSLDLVFIDADKTNYSNYFDLVIPKMPIGSYIVADNVLWSGEVMAENQDEDAKALHAFNQKVHHDPRVKNLLLPIRDGLMLLEKIAN